MTADPYVLTKMDVAALRHANFLHVSFDAADSRAFVRAIKTVAKTERNPFAQDADHIMPAPVGTHYDYERDLSSCKCSALIWLYPGQHYHADSVLATLRAGDAIRFEFWPDAHTNGYCEAAGLHGDALYLHVSRAGKPVAMWELSDGMCEDNSARMSRNVYKRATEGAGA